MSVAICLAILTRVMLSQRSDHTMIYTNILGQTGLRPDGSKGFRTGEVQFSSSRIDAI